MSAENQTPIRRVTSSPSMTSETIISNKIIISNRCTHPALMPLLAALTLIVSACGEGEGPSSGEDEVAAAEAETAIVDIDLDEYTVLMDPVLPAGPVTLRLANRGFEEHNLLFVVFESDSTVWETERRLSPGERRSVTIDLAPGTYRAVCNFSGHEGRGMLVNFAVRETT